MNIYAGGDYDGVGVANYYAKCGADTCAPPAKLIVESATDKDAALMWQTAESAIAYELTYKAEGDADYSAPFSVANTSYLLKNLQASKKYFVRLRSLCADSTLSEDIEAEFITKAKPLTCSAPDSVVFVWNSATSLKVTWKRAANAFRYMVQYREKGASAWRRVTISAPQIQIPRLDNSKTYEVKIQTTCEVGYSPLSSSYFVEPDNCKKPTNVVITDVTSSSAFVSWLGEGSTFRVRYKRKSESAYIFEDVTTHSYTIRNLTPETEYLVEVARMCEGGKSSVYASVAFGTQENTSCEKPANLSVIFHDSTTISVSWGEVANAKSYEFSYRLATEPLYTPINAVTPSVKLEKLLTGKQYQFRIRAVCSAGKSEYVSGTFTTKKVETCATTSISRISTTTGGASVSWRSTTTATKYVVEYYKQSGGARKQVTVDAPTLKTFLTVVPKTVYEVRVKSICSDGKESAYSFPVPFNSDFRLGETFSATQKTISAYPNPARDIITISGGRGSVATLSDMTGKMIRNVSLTADEQTMDICEVAAGMYLLRVGAEAIKITVTK